MGILDYFRPVPSMSAEQARKFMDDRGLGEGTLVDVRQPREYEQGHLPGAMLMPLGKLGQLMGQLDPEKPLIAYCASGARSRSAAQMFLRAGFKEVYSLDGGIQAWKGLVAEGPPEGGVAYFSASTTPEEYAALAWVTEDGSARFYREVSLQFKDIETRRLFSRLSHAEESHKAALGELYRRFSGAESAEGFPANVLGEDPQGNIMEGGISVPDALAWAKGRDPNALLELLMSLETNSFDLYMRMARAVEDEQARHLFIMLSEEERKHMEVLTGILDRRLA